MLVSPLYNTPQIPDMKRPVVTSSCYCSLDLTSLLFCILPALLSGLFFTRYSYVTQSVHMHAALQLAPEVCVARTLAELSMAPVHLQWFPFPLQSLQRGFRDPQGHPYTSQ